MSRERLYKPNGATAIADTLDMYDKEELPLLWCELNGPFFYHRGCNWRNNIEVMNMIRDRVGDEAVSRAWNCEWRTDKNAMNPEQHKKWWIKNYGGN